MQRILATRRRAGRAVTGGVLSLTGLLLAGYASAFVSGSSVDLEVVASMLPTPSVAVSILQAPSGVGIGGQLSYKIVVANTSFATITGLTVVDTVSAVLAGTATDQPAGFGAPIATSVSGGTRYEWSATGVSLGLGASFTFTVSGRAGVVCMPTAVSNTGYVIASSAGGTYRSFTGVVGCVIQPPSSGISIVKTQIPAAPVAGGPVQYQIAVTNTGAATMTNVIVVDTVAPQMTGVAISTPAGFVAQPITENTSGTVYSWASTGPLLPGVTATFQLDGTVGAVCFQTAMSNTAYVTAQTACTATSMASNGTAYVLAAPTMAFTAVETQTGGAGIGAPVQYDLVITNTGSVAIDSLTIVDTISPVVQNVIPTQPAPFAAPVVTSVTSGTRYEWSASGLGLAPLGSLTFTLAGNYGVVCASTRVSNTAYVTVRDVTNCAQVPGFSNVVGSVVQPAVTGLSIVRTQTPPAPVAGAAVTYQIVVANTGTMTITSLTVTDTVSPVVEAAAGDQPPGFGAAGISGSAGGTLFAWSNNATSLVPGQVFTFTVTGTVGLVCANTAVSNTAFVVGSGACSATALGTSLSGGFVLAAPVMDFSVVKQVTGGGAAGSPVTFTIVVTNTGSAGIEKLTIVDTVSSILVNQAAGTPAGWAAPAVTSVTGGTRYVWSATGIDLAAGTSTTFTVSGNVGVVCAGAALSNTAFAVGGLLSCPVETAHTSNVVGFVVNAPVLSFSAVKSVLAGGGTGIGSAVTYELVVTNTGEATIDSLTIVDTISPVVQNVTPTQPGSFGAPAVTAVASGTRYMWSASGLSFGPGASLTFDLAGNYGVVCSITNVSATAFVIAASCNQVTGYSNVVGAVVRPATLAYTMVKTQSSPAPLAGDPQTYQIAVTNTGAATITNLVVVDTVAANVTVGTQNAPAGFVAQPVAQGLTGTIYSWASTADFLPGATATFQLDGTVGPVCFQTAVSNTAYLVAATACTATRMASNVTGYVMAAPAMSYTVVNTQTGGAGIGAPVQYQIQVTNTGAAVIDSLTIVDTVSAVVQNVTTTQPGFGAPVVTSVTGGTRYEWTGSGLGIVPAGSITVTIDGYTGVVCASARVSNTAYVMARDSVGCAQVPQFSNVVGSVIAPATTGVSLVQTMTPASPTSTGPVSYLIVVTNTGSATVSSLTVTDTFSPVVTGISTFQTAPFGAPVVSSGPSGTLYAWTAAVAMTPGMSFTFTVSGTVGVVGASTTVGNTAFVAGVTPCAVPQAVAVGPAFTIGPSVTLAASMSAGPAVVSTGQKFLVTMTVTNSGAGPATSVSATLWVSTGPGLASWTALHTPAAPASVPAGSMVVFTWTATAGSAGVVGWSGSVVAAEGSASASATPNVTIQNAAYLVANASPTALNVCTGGTWMTVVSVLNSGDASANSVTAGLWNAGGTGTFSVAGPWPASASLSGGMAVTSFTFTVTGVSAGTVTLSTTSSGVDANSGLPVFSTVATSPTVNVSAGAALTASLSLPATVSVGQPFMATVFMDNTAGGSPVTGATVTATATIGSGNATAPAPASQTVAAGGTGQATWAYTALSPGTHSFSVTVAGMACGVPVSLVRGGVVTAQAAAALSGTLVVTTPTPTTVGSMVVVTLTVTNTGGAAVNGLTASLVPVGALGTLGGPVPAGPFVLTGGAGQVFVWTYTTSGAGALSFNWNASGVDANSGGAVSAAATGGGGMQVVTGAALTVAATATPGAVCIGQPIVVTVLVSNTGQATANSVSAAAFAISGGGVATPVAGPTPPMPASVGGGSAQEFTWTFTGSAAGPVVLTTTVTATDAVSGAPIAVGPRATGAVTVTAGATLAAALSVSPPAASVGQNVTLTMTVTNTGGTAAAGVNGVMAALAGTGAFISSPTAQTINGGAAALFVWTYRVDAAGTHVFSVTTSGTTCGSVTVQDVAGASLAAVSPATLSGYLVVTTPATTVQGELVVATMTVTNTGTAAANGVTASLTPAGVAGSLNGPSPAGPVVIAGGTSRTFIWSYTTTGAGSLSFNGSAAGTDANSGVAIGTGGLGTSAVTVQSSAQLVIASLDVTPGIRVGEVLSATVTIQNTGQADANNVTLARPVWDPNGVLGAPSPGLPAPFTLSGGASTSFLWWYPSTSCGPLAVSLTVTGIEAFSGTPLWAGATRPSGVAGLPSFVDAGANPVKGLVGTISYISVTVYDSCTPAVRVPDVSVSLYVIAGNGRLGATSMATGASGSVSTTFWIGGEAGVNAIRIDVAGTTGATVQIDGTALSTNKDWLTKNFFNPGRGEKVQVRVFVPTPVRVSVRVYNMAAELVRVVREAEVPTGMVAWEWDGRNDLGQLVGNGTYFVQIVAGKHTQIRRVIVLKR